MADIAGLHIDDKPDEVKSSDGEEEHSELPEATPSNANLSIATGGKKKRKKKKPKSKRGLKAPTGFEEYYVDGPITPEQHEEERGLYDASRPFPERIETAVQRYFAKRNLDSERKNVFDKYLAFGGIDAGPKAFSGGLDAGTVANSNAATIASMTATHTVPLDRYNSYNKDFVVDFEGCLKGFLSCRLPEVFELDNDVRISKFIGVIRNFLRYLLFHHVCPEYEAQVQASMLICDTAETELSYIADVRNLFPGLFNRACSQLSGGIYKIDASSNGHEWLNEGEHFGRDLSVEHARRIFKIGFAAYANEGQISRYKADTFERATERVSTYDTSLEVTGTTLGESIALTRRLYSQEDQASDDELPMLGILHARTWHHPATRPADLTPSEIASLHNNPPALHEYEFWVEDGILQRLVVGMKLEATVHEMRCGVFFFDAVFGVYCSFFELLPNQLMLNWRTVEKKWLPRRPQGEEEQAEGVEDEQMQDDGIEKEDA